MKRSLLFVIMLFSFLCASAHEEFVSYNKKQQTTITQPETPDTEKGNDYGPNRLQGKTIEINEENFPDPNFRAWLLEQRYGKDGVLTDEEIGEVDELYIYQKGIKSAEGIGFFSALRYLSIVKNDLTELDLSGLTELISLGLQENQLTKLNILDCTKILFLNCRRNKLSELNLSGQAELEQLNCDDNQLTELDLSGHMLLTNISCERNQLSKLILPHTELVTRIKCGDNRLTKIDISDLPRLDWLYCYGNQIGSEAMDDIIENLPAAYGGGAFFYVIRGDIPDGNVCTRDQVAAARAKGWIPRTYSNGGGSKEYEGTDPVSVAEIQVEKADGLWYDLGGRKLSPGLTPDPSPVSEGSKMQLPKGIYIVNGKKVVGR